jgi:hypothetical protein
MTDPLIKLDELSRRRVISSAAKAFLGVGALPLASRLAPDAHAATTPARSFGKAKRLIYLYMNGGMSQLETFDPKPGHKNQGPTKTINTNVDRIQFAAPLGRLARQADKLAIIRSLYTKAGVHGAGNYRMHTSYDPINTIRHPGIGAWALKFHGKLNPDLPGSVFIGAASRINGGGGFFDPEYHPLVISKPTDGLQFASRRRELSQAMFEDGRQLMQAIDQNLQSRYKLREVRAHSEAYDAAVRLMNSADLEAFMLEKEPQAVRQAYGESSFGKGCLLARRLIERGVRAVEVESGGWDTHVDNFSQTPELAAALDQALSALLVDLERRGLLKDTVVVVATEFGRTPRINQNLGRDHYPQAFSCALAGAGIKGGTIYGQTSPSGEEIVGDEVRVKDFNATIAHTLGLPLEQPVMSPSLRPFTAANKGKPIHDVLA